MITLLLANWLNSELETVLFHKHPEPKMYCRYVDDIYCVFRSGKQGTLFTEKLNNLHNTMMFTMNTIALKMNYHFLILT